MLTAKNLKGNWGTLLLPINEDNSIDFGRLGNELDYMTAAKIDGIYSNGTAGEFHNQSEAEFDKIQELMAEKCRRAGMPFQIGASHPSPLISLERLRRARSLNPSAFQIILPDWVTPNSKERTDFIAGMVDAAADIPLVLYNPPHAKQVLNPSDLQELSKTFPQLIGVKLAGGNEDWFRQMKWSIDSFSVFVPGHFLATGFATGVADGAYSNVACINPKAAQDWWNQMQTDIRSAISLQERILAFFEECIVPFKNAGFSNPALDKLLAAVGGWSDIGTRLRWPYRWIPPDVVKKVADRAKYHLPEFFKVQL
ncbi:dihydrodipicolinate synthase family protein [Pollutibacter soli]|uniref:dihydrodipicolinate synthase family protein n=1 Tax=Pollutibacter soli TaxID=3034157 RepID=UPI003013CC56